MIPVRLKMRNFMPYKGDTPELSFVGIHTACISGENGSGKSSIIDAMTWALWGKARARSDDELVHQGECEMEVEFDFNLGNELYRVIRKYAKSKTRRASGKGSFDLFIYNGASFISITADNKTQTEQKIAGLLHMDYETFINSAFLRQGHADEFSRQTPAKRKEVLASILGLEKYDEYEARAKNRAREAEDEKLRLNLNIGEMMSELDKRCEVEAELSGASTEFKDIERQLVYSQAGLSQLENERQELIALESHSRQLDEALSRHEADIIIWEAVLAQSSGKMAEYQKLIARKDDIEADFKRLQSARTIDDEMDNTSRRLYLLKERRGKYEREYLQAQNELNARSKVVEDRITTLEEKASRLPDLRRELAAAQPRYKELNEIQASIANYRALAKEKLEKLARLDADIEFLKSDVEQVQKKLNLLLAPSDGSRCPLCESNLGEERIRRVAEKLKNEQVEKEAQAATLKVARQSGAEQVNQLNRDLDVAEVVYQEKSNAILTEVARLTESIKDASASADQVKIEKEMLSEITGRLARRDFAAGLLDRLAEIEKSVAEIDYDLSQHEAVKQELKMLEQSEERKRALDAALEHLPDELERSRKAQLSLEGLKIRHTKDRETRDLLCSRLTSLPHLESEIATARAEQSRLSELNRNAQERLGSLKQRMAHLDDVGVKLKERQKALNAAGRRAGIYQELALAFGKKGIQAMLIETTLPEIEDEANRLLAKMSDGRMSVTFETQRDTKKGEVAETLDIKIADELGTRNYEMFSGGEAFRIDFAIRISLSRLLARRAGSPLPTLIIDEGFGTQDAEGIEKLKDAINSIQDEFRKIIVITHIEELKDAFPTRINIVKMADGSIIEVNGG
jgi:exonuclease SbcC